MPFRFDDVALQTVKKKKKWQEENQTERCTVCILCMQRMDSATTAAVQAAVPKLLWTHCSTSLLRWPSWGWSCATSTSATGNGALLSLEYYSSLGQVYFDVWVLCGYPVWDLRAVIWFHLSTCSLVILRSPVAPVFSFFCFWPSLLPTFQKFL